MPETMNEPRPWRTYYRYLVRRHKERTKLFVNQASFNIGFLASIGAAFGSLLDGFVEQDPSTVSFKSMWTNVGTNLSNIIMGNVGVQHKKLVEIGERVNKISEGNNGDESQETLQEKQEKPSWGQRISNYFAGYKTMGSLFQPEVKSDKSNPSFFSSLKPLRLLNPFVYAYSGISGGMLIWSNLVDKFDKLFTGEKGLRSESSLPAKILKGLVDVPGLFIQTGIAGLANPRLLPIFKAKNTSEKTNSENSDNQHLSENPKNTSTDRVKSQRNLMTSLQSGSHNKLVEPAAPEGKKETLTITETNKPASLKRMGFFESIRMLWSANTTKANDNPPQETKSEKLKQ